MTIFTTGTIGSFFKVFLDVFLAAFMVFFVTESMSYAIIARSIYVRRHQRCHHRRLQIEVGEGANIPDIRIW